MCHVVSMHKGKSLAIVSAGILLLLCTHLKDLSQKVYNFPDGLKRWIVVATKEWHNQDIRFGVRTKAKDVVDRDAMVFWGSKFGGGKKLRDVGFKRMRRLQDRLENDGRAIRSSLRVHDMRVLRSTCHFPRRQVCADVRTDNLGRSSHSCHFLLFVDQEGTYPPFGLYRAGSRYPAFASSSNRLDQSCSTWVSCSGTKRSPVGLSAFDIASRDSRTDMEVEGSGQETRRTSPTQPTGGVLRDAERRTGTKTRSPAPPVGLWQLSDCRPQRSAQHSALSAQRSAFAIC
jgi:hypothetical protein